MLQFMNALRIGIKLTGEDKSYFYLTSYGLVFQLIHDFFFTVLKTDNQILH